MNYRTIEELKGETLTAVEHGNDEIVFTTQSGRRFHMYHQEDCCEYVTISGIDGDLQALVGQEILVAKEEPGHEDGESYESVTFTDFQLNNVTIHWTGSSNGYYSESVLFIEL